MADQADADNGSANNGAVLKAILAELGATRTQLGVMQGSLAILLDDRRHASESRGKIYARLETVDVRLARCEHAIGRIDGLDRSVDDLESQRDKAAGVVCALRFVWMGIGSVILAAAGWAAHRFGLKS
jgi:hypothetical protein